MRTVLIYEHVTGGGLAGRELPESWAVEGRAMRRALATDFAAVPGVRVLMALDARLPDEPGPWTVARVVDPRSIASLAAEVDHTAPIAPETDGVLGQLARILPNSLGCLPDAIDLAADKLRLAALLIAAGVPTPRTLEVRPRQGLPHDFSYPAVLKPIDGAGAMDTLFITSPFDPMIAAFPLEIGVLQPIVRGEPRSATFIGRPGRSATLIGVARQEIRCEGGRFAYRGGAILAETLPPDHPSRRAVAVVPGLRGPVGVDYLHDPETGLDTVIEINPRPTTSCVGLVAALGPGRFAAAWLSALRRIDESCDMSVHSAHPIGFSSDGTLLSRIDPS